MTDFIRPTPQIEATTNCFYNAASQDTPKNSPKLVGSNNEWIWLILIAFIFLYCKDAFAGSEGKSFNTLIIVILAFVFFSNTTSLK